MNYIGVSHRDERADQFLAWKASRVPSCVRLPHQSQRAIRYINGIIAEVSECDVFDTKEDRLSEIASSYIFRLHCQDETDGGMSVIVSGPRILIYPTNTSHYLRVR
jgi:hypothetical protein